MSSTTQPHSHFLKGPSKNPWLFVPLLYFLQAIPVSLIQDVSTIVYKDLGIENVAITQWTSLIALPWTLQLFMGPLVDLSGTRRSWVMRCQALITLGLMLAPFAMKTPAAFELSLGAFLVAAIFSALCNAAMDGFYLLAMPKDSQAKFAGVQTTCYRLGTLFAKGLLVFLAGMLMAFPSMEVSSPQSPIQFKNGNKIISKTTTELKITAGNITNGDGHELLSPIKVPPTATALKIDANGTVEADGKKIGDLGLTNGATVEPVESKAKFSRQDAWAIILFAGAVLYGLLYCVERVTTPRPVEDVEAPNDKAELHRNITRTLNVVGLGLAGYFLLNSVVRMGAYGLWKVLDGNPKGPLKGWYLNENQTLFVLTIPGSGVIAELIQFAITAVAVIVLAKTAKRSIVGTPMGDAFTSYFKQSGIVAILCFLMFYRFGEAMVAKITPLFLKDSFEKGGLALSTEQVGTVKGVVGVFGIVLGGLAGGWIVGKLGLRKSFWFIAVCMHLPNLLYLWASIVRPGLASIYPIDFVEQFGYGFGFAGYIIYQMRVAQRGNYRTAHYALGVGIGAAFIQVAGVLSGTIQSNFGYTWLFAAAILCAVPGLLTLLFIPLDEPAQ